MVAGTLVGAGALVSGGVLVGAGTIAVIAGDEVGGGAVLAGAAAVGAGGALGEAGSAGAGPGRGATVTVPVTAGGTTVTAGGDGNGNGAAGSDFCASCAVSAVHAADNLARTSGSRTAVKAVLTRSNAIRAVSGEPESNARCASPSSVCAVVTAATERAWSA